MKREWSLETKLKAVAAADFDGIAAALTPTHRLRAEKHGLSRLLGFISLNDPDRFRPLLLAQKEGGAVHINVYMTTTTLHPPSRPATGCDRPRRRGDRRAGAVG